MKLPGYTIPKPLFLASIVTGFIVGLALLWVKLEYDRFSDTSLAVGQEGLHLVIPSGATISSIADKLQQRGVLEHPSYLILLARWQGVARDIKAGDYHVQPETTPAEFLHQIVAGKVAQYSLILIEGWTFSQVMAAIRNNSHLRQTLEGLQADEVMGHLGYPDQHPEGRFFPDTYYFPAGTTDLALLKNAYQLMKRHVAREWRHRAPGLPYKNPYEALVLASIIERESALPEERPLIARVFLNRLRKGVPLQADPTVIYGLGDEFDGDLRRKDLRSDTPYNTYTRSGLPPTPICMPGLGSLHAALHPAEGEALYFVSRGDGSHQFSATLEEHRAAVRTYQLDRAE